MINEDKPGIGWRIIGWIATKIYKLVTKREYGRPQ